MMEDPFVFQCIDRQPLWLARRGWWAVWGLRVSAAAPFSVCSLCVCTQLFHQQQLKGKRRRLFNICRDQNIAHEGPGLVHLAARRSCYIGASRSYPFNLELRKIYIIQALKSIVR